MPIDFEKVQGNVVIVSATGRLTDEDYKTSFVPTLEDLIDKWGALRMLFIMREGFEGWDLHGAWDELKFEVKHMGDVVKVGVVGDERWERWATKLSKLLTRANVQFFPHADEADAREWITAGW